MAQTTGPALKRASGPEKGLCKQNGGKPPERRSLLGQLAQPPTQSGGHAAKPLMAPHIKAGLVANLDIDTGAGNAGRLNHQRKPRWIAGNTTRRQAPNAHEPAGHKETGLRPPPAHYGPRRATYTAR